MSSHTHVVDIHKVDIAQIETRSDDVAIEEPLEIQLVSAAAAGAAAKSVSITMRTPGNDHGLALGFLYTEGIIDAYENIDGVESLGEIDARSGQKNIVRVQVNEGIDLQLDRLERHFYTTSSCGVCGKASLDALRVTGQKSLLEQETTFSRQMLIELPDRVRTLQPLFSKTGGLHAAAIFGSDGEIMVVREDIGRHNATDKAIGALLVSGDLPGHPYGLLVSGRASFELMQKALVAGIPFLAAVGAPSSLAVQTAADFGMTLVGFLRNNAFNIYANPQRIC